VRPIPNRVKHVLPAEYGRSSKPWQRLARPFARSRVPATRIPAHRKPLLRLALKTRDPCGSARRVAWHVRCTSTRGARRQPHGGTSYGYAHTAGKTTGVRRKARLRCAALAGVAAAVLLARGAGASGLLQGAVGPGDMATGGATVAEPLSPSGALFANPAGSRAFPRLRSRARSASASVTRRSRPTPATITTTTSSR
jgi:hypothetical protein